MPSARTPITSPAAAEGLAATLDVPLRDQDEMLRAAGFDPLVADAPDLSAMARACGLGSVTDPSFREMPS